MLITLATYIFSDGKSSENFTDETRVERAIPTMPRKLSHSQTGKISQRVYESYYAATDILTVRKLAISVNSNFTIANEIRSVHVMVRFR